MKLKKYILIIMTIFMINIGTAYALDTNNVALVAANQAECDSLFTPEIKELINDVLGYVRIIVPILVIVLGSIDLAKAVVAAKEDDIKKAQKKFIMRIIAGVVVFFVPVIVNIVMWLADQMQAIGTGCKL